MSDELSSYRLSRARRDARGRSAAASRYAQVRLTVTFERSGRADYRAMTKAPHEAWQETKVFAMGHEQFGTYPPDFHAALEYFELVAARLRWMPSER